MFNDELVVNQLIQNKLIAIILAVLTFILGSVVLVSIILYIFGYPLSSIPQHQLYAFFGVLVAAVLASMVYGSLGRQKASKVSEILNESWGLEIKEKDARKLLRMLERIPPFLINQYISKDINAVKEFEDQIEKYEGQLTDEDLLKIRKILEMSVPELQNLLKKLYVETDLEQFKVLADAEAEPFLALNLKELRRVLFNG